MNSASTQIFIAGAGPVGMTLALELAHHGVRSVIVERNATTTRHPKMDLTNGRSMELFRRLGVVEDLRAVGVPPSEALDVIWATKGTGHVLHRFAYPSPDEYRQRARTNNDGTATLEPPMRVSQVVLEPVLKAQIEANPLIDVRYGWAFESFDQDGDGVTVTIASSATGEKATVRSDYLVGCDGGGSRVRQQASIALEGQHAVAEAYMVHFRSTDQEVLGKFGAFYHLQTGLGTIVAQNGKDIWTLQSLAPPDTDPHDILTRFMGAELDYELLVANPWTPHVVLAETYRNGRVFLAGDAAHQVIPTGGYGMNTGIGDAIDLGWKLAAVENGWGGDALLDSYDVERRQIGEQNRAAAMRHLELRLTITECIEQAEAAHDLDAPGSAEAREALGARIAALGNAENESWGIEYGFRYTGSSVIADEGSAPPFDPLACPSFAVVGGRLPSYYLSDGRPLLDCLGREMTLLSIGNHDLGDLEGAAGELSIPLQIVRLANEAILERLGAGLILVRPDQHIAWCGDDAPADWSGLLRQLSGRPLHQRTKEVA
ncbi:2,4-dichlorophenol 6-monooxygenase [Sphingobium chlorophenolicum L-1]|uniref:2,4-dichlorophenol 6-monooxygenase n=2 Tax=Sphingobium chlorophenolicum TaxID=46429 RepID=F6F223_SPHCR|nr:FAD-dependent monooxygenase [Sphingobium chlorophenolicum]AAM96655.1 putative 2,4-dihydroxybenzoate monooxygenase [Sphingobium chlorophenolicum L-1]AEG51589.1 2,4-dichlorophenol 6-monooxygenase [Sphingobium chlorophenolicum L-1]